MTGFGAGRAGDDTLSVVVEMRSVNNRFLDLNIRLPRSLNEHETELRNIISKKLHRGRVTIYVNEEWSDSDGPKISLDRSKALGYSKVIKDLSDVLNLKGEIGLNHILTFPDLIRTEEDEEYRNRLWQLSKLSLKKAIEQLVESSVKEADSLCVDIKQRLDNLRLNLLQVEESAKQQAVKYKQRLLDRLSELMDDTRLDPVRLEMEIALAADRLDISEEIVRLKSHIDMFESKLKLSEPIGKTLNFILQEIGREVNTITSKSWLVDVSQTGVKMKEIVEQIREQVQNIE